MSPFALPKSQADIVENVRFGEEFKSLTKRDETLTACTAHATNPILGLHRFYKKDGSKVAIVNHGSTIATCDLSSGSPTSILTVTTADNRWDWTTWHDIAIGTDGANPSVKFDASTTSVANNSYTHFKCNDDAANTTVTDDGTGSNNGTSSTNTSNLSVTGKVNDAFEFVSANSEYLNIDDVATDIASDTTGSFSLWVYPTGSTGYIYTFSDADTNNKLYLYYYTSGMIQMGLTVNGTSKWTWWSSIDAIDLNTWTHITVVHNGTQPSVYANGSPHAGSFPTSTDKTAWMSSLSGVDTGRIGCYNANNSGNNQFFDGYVDDFRYYQNEVLSDSQIAEIYNSGSGKETGIDATLVYNSATYLGAPLALDKGSGAGPDGTYTYKVTCYTSSYETALNVASNSVTVSDNDITLSMIPICPDSYLGETVTGRKIYRSDDGGAGTYNLVPNTGTIADNSTTTIDDSETDVAVDAEAAYPTTYIDSPPLGRFGLIHKNRLWIANNSTNPSRLYYSEDGLHDFFLSDSYFDIRPNDGDEITFVENWLGLLTVSKNNTIQKVDTRKDDPDADWEITDPFSFIGCQAPYSAVPTDTGIMYLGNNGIYNFTGQYSELISDAITPTIRDISSSNFANVWAEYFKNSYYLTYASVATGSATNNRLLVVDLIDKSFGIDLLAINVLHNFKSGSDIEALYSGASDSGKIYSHVETMKELIHKKHSDFGGSWGDMRYVPTIVGGDEDNAELEMAWGVTIDDTSDPRWGGIINNMGTRIIDRPDTDGVYTSDTVEINASSLDKLYWNETLPAGGGDVTFDIRTGASAAGITNASWTTGFTNSAGDDISTVTGDTVLQYRINMSSTLIAETPTVFSGGDYAVRITYNTSGTTDETTIPIRWRSGWLDFGLPGYVKELRKIYVYYDWPEDTEGTLNLDFESFQGETDSFEIDLEANPDYYINYFPDGNMIGELIRLDITESSLFHIKIQKIIIVYNVQVPLT